MGGLTRENCGRGFLVDDELLAGVTEDQGASAYTAFVLRHTTGEYLGHRPGLALDDALKLLNEIPRSWVYEASGGACDGTKCAEGTCKGEKCRAFQPQRR